MPKCEWRDTDHSPKCGEPGYRDRSYCPNHVWLIYQKGTGIKAREPRKPKEVDTTGKTC